MAIMNRDRANRTYKKFHIESTGTVLEISYGSGTVIQKMAKNLTISQIFGIDYADMYKQALKGNKEYLLTNQPRNAN